MQKKLIYQGIEYPLQFNFLVFRNWEKATGHKFTDIQQLAENAGATEVVDVLSLLYFAIEDACNEQGKEFNFTLNQFIRGLDMSKTEQMMSMISLSDEEQEKEGQPIEQKDLA